MLRFSCESIDVNVDDGAGRTSEDVVRAESMPVTKRTPPGGTAVGRCSGAEPWVRPGAATDATLFSRLIGIGRYCFGRIGGGRLTVVAAIARIGGGDEEEEDAPLVRSCALASDAFARTIRRGLNEVGTQTRLVTAARSVVPEVGSRVEWRRTTGSCCVAWSCE